MFLTIGTIMLVYGVATWHNPMYVRSLGENINVLWGAVMLLFGGTMFLLGMRSRRADQAHPAAHGNGTGSAERRGH